MNERDFKGVWIPKEIWLCKDLSALDRVIYAEIDSLDNENHCTASNEYFAEFCGVGEATVTRSIQKLIDKGYIEKVSFDGRHRVLKVIKQTNQNDYPPSSKRLANNIDNNLNIKKNISNNKLLDITGDDIIDNNTTKKPTKKKSRYDQFEDIIVQYTNNIVLQERLREYLRLRLDIAKDECKQFYVNMWKGLLNDLDRLASNTDTAIEIVEQSIRKGWKGFYAQKNYTNYNNSSVKSHPSERNVITDKKSDDELDLADEEY